MTYETAKEVERLFSYRPIRKFDDKIPIEELKTSVLHLWVEHSYL